MTILISTVHMFICKHLGKTRTGFRYMLRSPGDEISRVIEVPVISETPTTDIVPIDRFYRLDSSGFDARIAQNKGDKRPFAGLIGLKSKCVNTQAQGFPATPLFFCSRRLSISRPREHNGQSSGRNDSSLPTLGFLGMHPHKNKSPL